MCTIGNSFWTLDGCGMNAVFKQCDLVAATEFVIPKVEESEHAGEKIKYVAFTRKKGHDLPAWAGVNEYGVSFVAADSYLNKLKNSQGEKQKNTASVFDMYLKIITDYKNAKDAVSMAKEFYQTEHYADECTDILLIADAKEMYFIETMDGSVRILKRTDGHFASANHCRMFYGAVPYEQNHSTYLRLGRAEAMLQQRDDNTGIGDLLRDSYYGKTVWSICRYASVTDEDDEKENDLNEEMYYTQAAVIFTIRDCGGEQPNVICEYVLNGNAKESEGYVWRPFEGGTPESVRYIGKNENVTE